MKKALAHELLLPLKSEMKILGSPQGVPSGVMDEVFYLLGTCASLVAEVVQA